MLRYKNRGTVIEINLPEECGHTGYSVECRYWFNKEIGKYALSMWLKSNNCNETFKIDSQEIDTQFITSEKENIKMNICRIVEQASLSGFFDRYIERYEYTYACFNRGNELYEEERINVS